MNLCFKLCVYICSGGSNLCFDFAAHNLLLQFTLTAFHNLISSCLKKEVLIKH